MPNEEYFSWPMGHVDDFLGTTTGYLAFVPYAGVTVNYDEYTNLVSGRFKELGHNIISVHDSKNPKKIIEESNGIIIGGGNSFQLLKLLYEHNLIETITNKVNNGTPYIGWSAGSNVACPTIKTTNDMPIVQPTCFDALNLVPFQINPHFTEEILPNHGGETRSARIMEFLELNQEIFVVGLPEGTLLEIKESTIALKGKGPIKVFHKDFETKDYAEGEDIDFLLAS